MEKKIKKEREIMKNNIIIVKPNKLPLINYHCIYSVEDKEITIHNGGYHHFIAIQVKKTREVFNCYDSNIGNCYYPGRSMRGTFFLEDRFQGKFEEKKFKMTYFRFNDDKKCKFVKIIFKNNIKKKFFKMILLWFNSNDWIFQKNRSNTSKIVKRVKFENNTPVEIKFLDKNKKELVNITFDLMGIPKFNGFMID